MIKDSELRVKSSADIDPVFHKKFADDCFAFIALTPFGHLVQDIQETGSIAREQAQLHSDIDLNPKFASEEDRLLAIKLRQDNPAQWKIAVDFLNQLRVKYRCMIEFALQHYDLAATPKSYFSMREMKLYKQDDRKLDIDYKTKAVTIRPPKIRPPRFSICVFGSDGNPREFNPVTDTPDMYDPFFNKVATVKQKLGNRLLEFGGTEDTAYMKKNA